MLGKMVSVAAALLVAVLSYLTVNPEAHEFFHHEADHADHQCAVTAFATGEGLYVAPQIEVRPEAVVAERMHFVAGEVRRESAAYILPPGCGPPAHRLIA